MEKFIQTSLDLMVYISFYLSIILFHGPKVSVVKNQRHTHRVTLSYEFCLCPIPFLSRIGNLLDCFGITRQTHKTMGSAISLELWTHDGDGLGCANREKNASEFAVPPVCTATPLKVETHNLSSLFSLSWNNLLALVSFPFFFVSEKPWVGLCSGPYLKYNISYSPFLCFMFFVTFFHSYYQI